MFKRFAVAMGVVALVSVAAVAKRADRTYTVRRGDTLIGIAREVLGDAGRWREVADLNAIRNPRRLRIGQVLRLPPPPAPPTATPAAPQEPLATDPALRRRPGDRPELAPPAQAAPRVEAPAATAYPAPGEDAPPAARSRTAARMGARRAPPTAYWTGHAEPLARPSAWRGRPPGRAALAPAAHEAPERLGASRSSPTSYPRITAEGVAHRGAISERLRGLRRGARF